MIGMFIIGCEKRIDVGIPEQEPRIYISSQLAPGEPFVADISRTISVKDTFNWNSSDNANPNLPHPALLRKFVIRDADVKIYKNGLLHDSLKYDPQYKTYVTQSFKHAESGNTYKIVVRHSSFPEASAQATTDQSTVQIKKVDRRQSSAYKEDVVFNFDDPGSEPNYYLLSIYSYSLQFHDYIRYGFEISDPDIISASDLIFSNGNTWKYLLFKDTKFNGTEKFIKITVPQLIPANDNGAVYKPYIELQNISKDYYKYMVSLNAAAEISSNPILEPFVSYTNVKNGFGLFGTYQASYKAIE
jgi:hypothetical protein